jgi:hypothetical protein
MEGGYDNKIYSYMKIKQRKCAIFLYLPLGGYYYETVPRRKGRKEATYILEINK